MEKKLLVNRIKNSLGSQKEATFIFFGVKRRDKEDFFTNLSVMMSSGLDISGAISMLAEQSIGSFKKILLSMQASVNSGRTLSSAMSFYPNVFSEFMINTVRAGEKSANLDDNLKNIAEQIRKEATLINTIRQAMFYPFIVLCLSFVMGLILSFFVLPKITPIFSGLRVDLPLSTRFLIWFSAFLEEHVFVILSLLSLVVVAIIYLLRQRWIQPISHFILLRVPLMQRIIRAKNLAQANRIMGTMLRSGVGVDEALQVTQASLANYYYRHSLKRVYYRVKHGASLSGAFERELEFFPKLFLSLIKIGEKTGKLEDEFFYLATIYERQVDNDSKTISTAIEPILLILIGLVVGALAISIISPIYQVTGNIYH